MERWQTKLPARNDHNCLVTIQPRGASIRSVQVGWVCVDRISPCGVAWIPMPKHITDDSRGWFSPYRGDDYPTKSDWYLVCFEHCRWLIKKAWFDAKKDRFLGLPKPDRPQGDVIAWRPLPRPYTGSYGLR